MNKYNKDVVAFGDMPAKVQAEIKAAPVTRVDVACAGDPNDWASFQKGDTPFFMRTLAYRVRPKGVKSTIKAEPGPAKPTAKKVAKVEISQASTGCHGYWYDTYIGGCHCVMLGSVMKKATAIRRAQKFCADIGYECVIKE